MDNVGFGKRLGAYILDIIIFGIPMNILQFLMFGPEAFGGTEFNMGPVLFGFICGLAYIVGMWTYADGATLGKKIVKIKVVNNDSSPLTLGTAFGRYIGYIISAIPCLLGFLWVIWDSEKKGWHDKIAGTKVISA